MPHPRGKEGRGLSLPPGVVILMALLALWGLTLNLSLNGRDGIVIEKLLKQVSRVIL